MRERGSGCIVSVTSQGGRISVPTLATYSGSKFALEAVMEALAVEVAGHGIRVAIIEPGAIITPIINKAKPPPDGTPYPTMYHRFMTLAFHDFGRGSPAGVVADCISEAISTDEPRLRWPVGQGAERNLMTRASLSDEEFIATWNAPDDATFAKVMLGDEAP
jgi:NAD(P)-dependent dehydrogenase (short-subunit alcohol dehydrogenase family)